MTQCGCDGYWPAVLGRLSFARTLWAETRGVRVRGIIEINAEFQQLANRDLVGPPTCANLAFSNLAPDNFGMSADQKSEFCGSEE
jgi:hypothetical protein